MTPGDRIKACRLRLGLSVEELAQRLGKNRATVYRYEKNEITNIPQKLLGPLADALETTPAYLMGYAEDSVPAAIPGLMPAPALRRTPRLGTIACGEPILAEQNIQGYDLVPDWVQCDFTLQCKGDSMIGARIFDGDVVCIHAQPQVENGEIAAVLLEDEATLKRVRLYPDHIVLEPENPNYRPKVFWDEEMNQVQILGKATYFISPVR